MSIASSVEVGYRPLSLFRNVYAKERGTLMDVVYVRTSATMSLSGFILKRGFRNVLVFNGESGTASTHSRATSEAAETIDAANGHEQSRFT